MVVRGTQSSSEGGLPTIIDAAKAAAIAHHLPNWPDFSTAADAVPM